MKQKSERSEKRKLITTREYWKWTPSNKWRWKKKKKKEYPRRTGKLLKIKRHNWNLIKGINTWAVPLIKYSGQFFKWMWEELQQMNQRKSKLMTMQKVLHSGDNVDILYGSRKEGRRGHTSIEDSVDASIQRPEDYIKKTWTKTDYSYQKQYNTNINKTIMVRK